ncbi:hypothetical protein BLNAU_20951 [Blattamonas nauphoetae]|uniref:Uncharacterized protein n=1 Tax=Blattamonas nauphoetae TaxID=2049346 RepID=A0ABQ9WX86_9EUKA|nr:hypothetical protein BLNAU_20951 [Blattamonas nauphoetae]
MFTHHTGFFRLEDQKAKQASLLALIFQASLIFTFWLGLSEASSKLQPIYHHSSRVRRKGMKDTERRSSVI